MGIKSQYNIAFKGLGQGKHEFEYEIDRKFFESFDSDIVDDGNVTVKVILEKQSSLMVLWFYVNGTIRIQCGRCLELYDQPIKNQGRIFVKVGDEEFEEGDDVIWIDENDYQINVAQLIYEFICLAIPIRQVHPDNPDGSSSCNPEMLAKLKEYETNDSAEPEKKPTDSRWDDLKKLLDNE
jgi:uncharacterized metal-binding protein YceD (DUF177 family)